MALNINDIKDKVHQLKDETERFIDSLSDLRDSTDEVEIEAQIQVHMIEIESYVDLLKDEF